MMLVGVVDAVVDEKKKTITYNPVGVFTDYDLAVKFAEAYLKKYPERGLFPVDVPVDPAKAPRAKKDLNIKVSLAALIADNDGQFQHNINIPVGSFTDKKVMKEFKKDFEQTYPDFPLKEVDIPLDPTGPKMTLTEEFDAIIAPITGK